MLIQRITDSINKKTLIPAFVLAFLLPGIWGILAIIYFDDPPPRGIREILQLPVYAIDRFYRIYIVEIGSLGPTESVTFVIVGSVLLLFSIGLWTGYFGSLIFQWYINRNRKKDW